MTSDSRSALHAAVAGVGLLACASAGCAPADTREAAAVGTVLLAPPLAASAAATSAAAAELPRELSIDTPACSVRGRTWRVPTAALLHLAPAGGSFAEAWAGQAELVLPSGPITSALLRLDTPELTLVGWVDLPRVPLAPARPLLLAGFVSPKPRGALVVVDAAQRRVQVALSLVELEGGAVRDAVACNDLSLDALPFDPRPAIEGSAKRRAASLSPARPVPMSLEPSEAPVARLRATPASRDVTVVGMRAASSRIVWELEDAFVVGWVPSSDLGPARAASVEPPFVPVRGAASADPPVAFVECPRDVPLVASDEGQRAAVGAARAGARLELLDRGVGLRRVRVPTTGARTGGAAQLLVREVDLEPCKHVLPEP